MKLISVDRFRNNLNKLVERVTTEHRPLKVTRRGGERFVVVSAEDWECAQENLYVLQNNDLMRQSGDSLKIHDKCFGDAPTANEMNEVTGL